MTKQVKTYTDLLRAIGQDLKPRLKKSLPHLILDEALDEALNAGPTLELIAEFVGRRHIELNTDEANWKAEHAQQIRDQEQRL